MSRCVGGCLSPWTRLVGQEAVRSADPRRGVPFIVLHDLERCPRGAVVTVEQGSPVFEVGQ